MKRRDFITLLGGRAMLWPFSARAAGAKSRPLGFAQLSRVREPGGCSESFYLAIVDARGTLGVKFSDNLLSLADEVIE